MRRSTQATLAGMGIALWMGPFAMPAGADERLELRKVSAPDGQAWDQFGAAVAIDAPWLIVGASYGEGSAADSGVCYVFDLESGLHLGKLMATDSSGVDLLGVTLASSNGIAIAGAPYHRVDGHPRGAAYLFDVTTLGQHAKLVPHDHRIYQDFGYSVAIDGDRAVVGAFSDWQNGYYAGAAYLFDVASGAQITKIMPTDGAKRDHFGNSVAIAGPIILIGAYNDWVRGDDAGSAYLFDADLMIETDRLAAWDGGPSEFFGQSVATNGKLALVGADGVDDLGAFSGAAYVFDVATGRPRAKLRSDDGRIQDHFGQAVAVSGNSAVIAAQGCDLQQANAGAAYLFDLATGRQFAKLMASDGAAQDFLGRSVAIQGESCAVGAMWDDDHGEDSGSVYIFASGGGDRLLLSDPVPSEAGVLNTIVASHAEPGARVHLVGGLAPGQHPVPGCTDLWIDITLPRVIATEPADAEGIAHFRVSVPLEYRHVFTYLQALHLEGCRTSEVVGVDWR